MTRRIQKSGQKIFLILIPKNVLLVSTKLYIKYDVCFRYKPELWSVFQIFYDLENSPKSESSLLILGKKMTGRN